jgi:hypothetical protein
MKTLKNILLMVAIALLAQANAFAQPYLATPTAADIPFTGGPSTSVNSAMIDYVNGNGGTLMAIAYPGGVRVKDLSYGTATTVVPAGIGGSPDVILGNKNGSTTDFIMAVAYYSSAAGGAYRIAFYDIVYTAPGTFTVVLNSALTIPLPSGFTPVGSSACIHIDVIADPDFPLSSGFPKCERFFVVFDAFDAFTNKNILCNHGNLSTYSIDYTASSINFSTFAITSDSTVGAGDSYQPDVAAVKIDSAGFERDLARVTYVNLLNQALYYQEWKVDPTGTIPYMSPGYITLLDTPNVPNVDFFPRIDAIDDYNITSGSIWKVVCAHRDSIWTFDNVLGPVAHWACSDDVDLSSEGGAASGPYRRPAVAYGSNNGNEYMVSFFTGTGGYFTMVPIDINTPNAVALDLLGSGSSSYYLVNTSYPAGGSVASAVSTPCNNVGGVSMVAWSTSAGISYKTTVYGAGAGYSYRPANTTVASDLAAPAVSIYPNPATDFITISDADGYAIRNIPGQTVGEGGLTSGTHKINIQNLPAGNYIINVYKEGKQPISEMFIKN